MPFEIDEYLRDASEDEKRRVLDTMTYGLKANREDVQRYIANIDSMTELAILEVQIASRKAQLESPNPILNCPFRKVMD